MAKFKPERYYLPLSHEPAMRVPRGGSMCANCSEYVPRGGKFGSCVAPEFFEYYGTRLIPVPANEFCSDWYAPR
jgi:hypothetical protein